MGQGLSIGFSDNTNQCLSKVDIKPGLFLNKKGSKTLEVHSNKIDIYWDFSSVKYGSGPEPLGGFYLAISSKQKLVLLIGDMDQEALKKTKVNTFPSNGVLISKREHVFGKDVFNSKARFCNLRNFHDLTIECDTNSAKNTCLIVRVDTKTVMKVNHLKWNFRGNQTILVDGIEVEVFWDVYNWLFGTSLGNAIFVFKTKASMEMMCAQKALSGEFQSVPRSWSQRFNESQSGDLGFSLVLFAWRNE